MLIVILGKMMERDLIMALCLLEGSEGIIDPHTSTQVGLRTVNYDDYGFDIVSALLIQRNGVESTRHNKK